MTMTTCEECKGKISTQADKCPHCGAKVSSGRIGALKWAIALFFGAVVFSCVSRTQDQSPPQGGKPMSNEDIQLNVAIAAGRSIKQSMKDPSSFHLENLYLFPDGSACFEYRAKNSFNATVPGKAVFDAKAGAITVSDENEHKLVSAWNRICTRTGATNNAKGIRQLGLL